MKLGRQSVIDLRKPRSEMNDEDWMRHAIRLAERAEQQGEVPVGAVMVYQNQVIAEGWNQPIQQNDPSAHAEIVAIRAAGVALNNYRLLDCTLYVTLEPCIMCLGAITNARINRLVFGAYDDKRGAICSALKLSEAKFLNHHCDWRGAILQDTCAKLLSDFFKAKRQT